MFSCISLTIHAGEFRGRVLTAQGNPVAGAKVSAIATDGSNPVETTSSTDGSYSLAGLPTGVYRLTAKASSATIDHQGSITEEAGIVQINLQFTQSEAQRSPTAEQRNPNIVVYQIDLNAVRALFDMFRGADPQYIASFPADQNYFGAEYGAQLLKFENLQPRASAKAWHGSAFGLYENSALNARSFFNLGRLMPSRYGSYNLSAGGPIKFKQGNLLMDFGQNFTSGIVNGNIQAPTASERTPRSSDARVNAIIAALISAFPAELPNEPNFGLRQLNTNAPREIKSTNGSVRMDLKPGEQSAFVIRYFIGDYYENPYQIIKGQFPTTDLRSQAVQIHWNKNLSPNATAQFGFKFDRTRAFLLPTAEFSNLLAPLGITNTPDIQISGNSGIGSLSQIGPGFRFPRRRLQNSFYYFSDVSHVVGKHSIKLGGSIARFQVNDLQSDYDRGQLVFAPDFGRTSVENFLMGTPSFYTVTFGNLYRGFRNWGSAFYIQDQICLSSAFIFNLGLRYEIESAPVEVNNLTSVGMHTDKNNFGPRVGLVWTPGGKTTLVRAAYGISYSNIFPITYQVTRFNPPAVQTLQLIAPNLLDVLTNAMMQSVQNGRSALSMLSPDLVMPYTHHYSLSIERPLPGATLLRVAYIGSRSFHLLTKGIYNRARPVQGIPTTTATINQRRADSRYYAINEVESNSIAYYDALQATLDKKLTHGLAFGASYTFSKSIDTGGDFTDTASGTEQPGIIGTPSCEPCDHVSDQKNVSLFDTPHIFAISYSYSIPSWKGAPRLGAAHLGGWHVSGTTNFQSGVPFLINTGSDAPGYGNVDGVGGDRPNILNRSILGLTIDNPHTSTSILNRAFFDTNIAPGGRGNIGNRVFRKDPVYNWNAAISRIFHIGKSENSVQFLMEFLNLLNHPQFDIPGINVVEESFGKITNTLNKGRQIQFSMRINF